MLLQMQLWLFLQFFIFCPFVTSLVQITSFHKMYSVTPVKHVHLHFLNQKRLLAPELIFWNGLGAVGEKVYILAQKETIAKHRLDIEHHNLTIKMAFDTVKLTYVAYNEERPNTVKTNTYLEQETADSDEDDDDMAVVAANAAQQEDDDDIGGSNSTKNVQKEVEKLIVVRKGKLGGDANFGELLETVASAPRSPGLMPVQEITSFDGKKLPIHCGVFYRIQALQTLVMGRLTTVPKGEWTALSENTSEPVGYTPFVGEYLAASIAKKRDGANPFITAEENPRKFKNAEYLVNATKTVLWVFVPSEFERFYEIRNRNFPMSLLVWRYDLDEGEFLLHLETRRQYLKRYLPEGVLRNRALFSFQMITSSFPWELRKGRPKFNLLTYSSNHIYLYESKLKGSSFLTVRNSGSHPYASDKTNKVGRNLDMFYLTRENLTAQYTASIFSFMFEKSIVDIFAESAAKGSIIHVCDFDLTNRSPLDVTEYVFQNVSMNNEFTFRFQDKFTKFQWVAIESQPPSFGIAPIITAGVLGRNTSTNVIKRSLQKAYKVQDKVNVESGTCVNASVFFQFIKDFENPFTALLEVTEPADRLYWGKDGKPRFVRLSLPGEFIERTWKSKANIKFDRVIEKREAAMVVQIRGTLRATYGLRAFIRKLNIQYAPAIVNCEQSS